MTEPDLRTRRELAARFDEMVRAMGGSTLALWVVGGGPALPSTASPLVHHGTGPTSSGPPTPDAVFANVVSKGQLGNAVHLPELLEWIATRMDADSMLWFCEPTEAAENSVFREPNDVTTTLWARGFTVIEVARLTARRGLRQLEFCWGRARLTPDHAPPRPWADRSGGTATPRR